MPGVHLVPWDPVRNAGPVEQEQGHGSGIGKPDAQPQGYGVEQDGPEPGQGRLAAIGDGTEGIGDFGTHGVFSILIFGPKTQIFTPEVHGRC